MGFSNLRVEYRNGQKVIIGRGEDTAREILKIFYPPKKAEIHTQLEVSTLVKEDELMGDFQGKRTVDLYMYYRKRDFVIRVQGMANHSGEIAGRKDRLQKELLERHKVKVIDLPFLECPEMFKERVNRDSILEVGNILKNEGVPK